MRIALALAGALALHYGLLAPYLHVADNDFDAIHLYLPLADGLASEGLRFFADERSVQAPPVSYLWPLLLGRSLATIKLVDAAMSGITLLLAFRIAWLAHSRTAGVVAAFMFAASPLLRPFLAAPITEPPYLLLNAAWMWALAEWLVAGRRAALVASAVALVLALLTRAVLFYWLPFLVVLFAFLAWRSQGGERRVARAAAAAYAIALLVPLALAAKNFVLFGLPFFVTGSGNALYLGNNPVTGGYDPNYVGLLFDVGSIARNQSFLTLEAERLLGGVARYMILQQSPADLLEMHLKKLAAFLFVTNAEPGALELRAWRVGLLAFAVPGVIAVRHGWLRLLLAGIALYQVAVHVPVVYTHRYSVGGLDLWLVILASIGLTHVATSTWHRPRAWTLVLLAALSVAAFVFGRLEEPHPWIFRGARLTVWEGTPFERRVGPGAAAVDISVRGTRRPFDRAFNYGLAMQAAISAGADCGPLRISYRRGEESLVHGPLSRQLEPGAAPRLLQFGFRELGLDADGTLRLDIDCRQPAALAVSRIGVYTLVGGIDYRERYLREPPLFPDLER